MEGEGLIWDPNLGNLERDLLTDSRLTPEIARELAGLAWLLPASQLRDNMAPSEMLRYLAALLREVENLELKLKQLPQLILWALVETEHTQGASSSPRLDAVNALRALAGLVIITERRLEAMPRTTGRGSSKYSAMIRYAAQCLVRCGLEADAKPTGPLCTAVGKMIQHVEGKSPSRVPIVVGHALKGVSKAWLAGDLHS